MKHYNNQNHVFSLKCFESFRISKSILKMFVFWLVEHILLSTVILNLWWTFSFLFSPSNFSEATHGGYLFWLNNEPKPILIGNQNVEECLHFGFWNTLVLVKVHAEEDSFQLRIGESHLRSDSHLNVSWHFIPAQCFFFFQIEHNPDLLNFWKKTDILRNRILGFSAMPHQIFNWKGGVRLTKHLAVRLW